jgi:hypothetical protein
VTGEQWLRLRKKLLAEEAYKAVEGMYDDLPVCESIDTADWPPEILEQLRSHAEKLSEEKNIPFDMAVSVIITSAIRMDTEHHTLGEGGEQ